MTTFQVAKADTVTAITPDGGVRAVGKGELVINAKDHGVTGNGSTSDTAAINALLAAVGAGGHILLAFGTFVVDGAILCQYSNQRITLDETATIQVPSGYNGNVFQIGGSGTVRGVVIAGGGTITEAGKSGGAATTLSDWTAFRFLSSGSGSQVNDNTINGIQVSFCGTVFAYQTSGGAINGNDVSGTVGLYFKKLVDVGLPAGGGSYSSNTISKVRGQCSNFTTYGVKGLTGVNWTLDDVRPWDVGNNPAAISCEILSTATYTRIRGGLITFQNFTDSGTVVSGQTIIDDPYQTRPWLKTELFQPSNMVARAIQSGINSTPTAVAPNDWQAWSYPTGNSGVGFMYRLPAGCSRAEVSLVVMDVSGGSGDAYWGVNFQVSPTAGVSTINTTTTNPASGGVATVVLPIKTALTGGGNYRITVNRTGSNAADTLAAAIGLVGVLIRPLK